MYGDGAYADAHEPYLMAVRDFERQSAFDLDDNGHNDDDRGREGLDGLELECKDRRWV